MLDPRKLMPLSIEDWSAPIAVITEITEKTPMVMPIIVRAARSLFAPNEASAIFTISLHSMLIYHRDHGGHGAIMRLLREVEHFAANAVREHAFIKINQKPHLEAA